MPLLGLAFSFLLISLGLWVNHGQSIIACNITHLRNCNKHMYRSFLWEQPKDEN